MPSQPKNRASEEILAMTRQTETQESHQVHLTVGDEQAASVQPRMIAYAGTAARTLVFALGAMMGVKAPSTPRKDRKPVPRMVCSPREEIFAHNAAVAKRSDRAARLDARRGNRSIAKTIKDSGQHPKFAKERTHKQHKHEQRDEFGVVTLVGSPYEMEGENLKPTTREHLFGGSVGPDGYTQYTARRIWLGGISAMRGY